MRIQTNKRVRRPCLTKLSATARACDLHKLLSSLREAVLQPGYRRFGAIPGDQALGLPEQMPDLVPGNSLVYSVQAQQYNIRRRRRSVWNVVLVARKIFRSARHPEAATEQIESRVPQSGSQPAGYKRHSGSGSGSTISAVSVQKHSIPTGGKNGQLIEQSISEEKVASDKEEIPALGTFSGFDSDLKHHVT